MKIDFGLEVAKHEILNIEWFIFSKIWAIGFWTIFSKFDDVILKYGDVIKTFFLKFFPLMMN